MFAIFVTFAVHAICLVKRISFSPNCIILRMFNILKLMVMFNVWHDINKNNNDVSDSLQLANMTVWRYSCTEQSVKLHMEKVKVPYMHATCR